MGDEAAFSALMAPCTILTSPGSLYGVEMGVRLHQSRTILLPFVRTFDGVSPSGAT